MKFGPVLAGVLYLLLVFSAALALWVRRFPGRLPLQLERGAPWLFLVFLAVFALYRLGLMRARKYPAAKGFFQIGAGLLFFMLLLPGTKRTYDAPSSDVGQLLLDTNPKVRALAAEVARHREDSPTFVKPLVQALHDDDPKVRDEAHRSLVAITGQDLGNPETEAGVQAWETRYP